MRSPINHSYILGFILLISCGNGSIERSKEANSANDKTASAPSGKAQQRTGIVGEWDQQYTCYDKNGDAKLDEGERAPAKQRLGFNYFRFNADGTCIRDKDVKFKGKYEIKETKSRKDLIINTVDGIYTGIKYSIKGEITNELVLYDSGVFLVFKRK